MDRIRPLLFVAMPFGRKKDPTGTHEIDFDRVYELAIRPAAEAADLEVIRADEERSGGIIHIPMFERLLLSEVVVADLTVQNANVFYELGVRHAARPRATILMYAKYPKEGQLPFDVNIIRATPYHLEEGELGEEEAERLRGELEAKFRAARDDYESKDSPLFQFVQDFPGISLPHEVTEAFRDRARYIDGVRERLAAARRTRDRAAALEAMGSIEAELQPFNQTHSELLIDLLLSYRDVKAWDEMVSLVERLPAGPLKAAVTIREQYALALNRRNGPEDRGRAIAEIKAVVEEHGLSPETCGVMGRIFKDRFEEVEKEEGRELAEPYLDEAIEWYRRGFEADPRDYYPGVNAATLLFIKGDPEALEELKTIGPAVAFAVARRGGLKSNDYWDVATVLEVSVLNEDWPNAKRALGRLLVFEVPAWQYETTNRNLKLVRDVRVSRALASDDLEQIVTRLEPKTV